LLVENMHFILLKLHLDIGECTKKLTVSSWIFDGGAALTQCYKWFLEDLVSKRANGPWLNRCLWTAKTWNSFN
jgi:hypothetical protein